MNQKNKQIVYNCDCHCHCDEIKRCNSNHSLIRDCEHCVEQPESVDDVKPWDDSKYESGQGKCTCINVHTADHDGFCPIFWLRAQDNRKHLKKAVKIIREFKKTQDKEEGCTCVCHCPKGCAFPKWGHARQSCSHCQDKEHKMGEHGAVGYVMQEGRVCVECREPIEDKEVPTSMSGAKEEGIEWYDHYFDTDRDLYFKIRDSIRQARREVAEEILKDIFGTRKQYVMYLKTHSGSPKLILEAIDGYDQIVDKYLSKEGGI